MGVLQRFEQRLDSMVNGAFAKAFRSEVQPVEIAGALVRELDDKAVPLGTDRTVGPNHFTVELGPHDHGRLGPYSVPLGAELAGMVKEHADASTIALLGQVEVDLVLADDLGTGVFRITSATTPGVTAQPKSRPLYEQVVNPDPVSPVPAAPTPAPIEPDPALPGGTLGETAVVMPAGEPGPTPAAQPVSNPRLVVHGTAYPLSKATVTIGRGSDVDIRIDDPGVSRRHAAFHVNQRGYDGPPCTVSDLASTNGTFVDDQRVSEAGLHDGDEVKVGSTTLVFRVG